LLSENNNEEDELEEEFDEIDENKIDEGSFYLQLRILLICSDRRY
jgi:hypothetical protein